MGVGLQAFTEGVPVGLSRRRPDLVEPSAPAPEERKARRVASVPDAVFADVRLAKVYDDLDGERRDLDHYARIVDEFDARSVLDVGCGTGAFAVRLARDGIDVTGVDPAEASLAVARRKPGAGRVRWVLGDASTATPMCVDLVTMTGNVAQVFVDDRSWEAALRACHDALDESGRLVFEVRNPACRGWEEWTPVASRSTSNTVSGPVESWVRLTQVALPLVSFRWTFRFLDDGTTLVSNSTLRFRSEFEIVQALAASGFEVDEVRDASDRPDREMVFIARKASRIHDCPIQPNQLDRSTMSPSVTDG